MASNKNYMLDDQFPKHIKNATSTSDGLLSALDKSRIDELFELGTLSPATVDKDGIMTSEDKFKLDNIEPGANKYVHPNNENTRHVTDEQINKWDNGLLYINNNPVKFPLGGIEEGDIFEINHNDLFTKLLYPYEYPVIENIYTDPIEAVYEKGYSAFLTSISFKVKTFLSDDVSLRYEFMIDDKVIKTLDTTSRNIEQTVSETLTENCSLNVKIIDTLNGKEKFYNLKNYFFIYPYYYGNALENDIIDKYLIQSRTKIVQYNGTKIIQYTTQNHRMLFAYPREYGELVAIYDMNSINIINTFNMSIIKLSQINSEEVEYNVYYNEPCSVSNYNIQFAMTDEDIDVVLKANIESSTETTELQKLENKINTRLEFVENKIKEAVFYG